MAHFKEVTSTSPSPGMTNAVIMGRKTWESIPPKFRPLPGRINIILSRTTTVDATGDVLVASSLDDAMSKIGSIPQIGTTYIIGGGEVYKTALESGLVHRVIYTRVHGMPEDTEFDAFFPEMKDEEWDCVPFFASSLSSSSADAPVGKRPKVETIAEEHVDAKSGLRYEFIEYIRRPPHRTVVTPTASAAAAAVVPEGPEVNPEEMQYLDVCRDILANGVRRGDRTGTGTLSKFGVQMRYSLRDDTLPLLTTKRTFWRGVAEELLWFIKGSTNAKWNKNMDTDEINAMVL